MNPSLYQRTPFCTFVVKIYLNQKLKESVIEFVRCLDVEKKPDVTGFFRKLGSGDQAI